MKLWIARNKSGALFLYGEKPIKVEEWGEFAYVSGRYIHLSHKLLPEVTWGNSPKQVEIKFID